MSMISAINERLVDFYAFEYLFIRIAIIICDLIGVLVLLTTVGKSVYHYFHRDRHVKTMLAQGIALSLEFKLAGEVLKTVTVRELSELVVLGAIVLLRGAITILIHWEIRAERREEEDERRLEAELALMHKQAKSD